MLSNKTWGIAGAAMLGTAVLLGTNAANALINLDAEDKSKAQTVFAKETLTTAVEGSDGYYQVTGARPAGGDMNEIHISGDVGVGGTVSSVLILKYTLGNMVFTEGSNPVLSFKAQESGDSPRPGMGNDVSGAVVTKRGGGDKGDTTVTFIHTRIDDTIAPNVEAFLTLDQLGVHGDGGGTIRMVVSDNLPLPEVHDTEAVAAIDIKAALKAVPGPLTPEAKVETGFLQFGTDAANLVLAASVGSFKLSSEMYKDAATETTETSTGAADDNGAGTDVLLSDLIDVGADIVDAANDGTPDNYAPADDGTKISFMGNFSFASRVSLDDDMTCSDETPAAANGDDGDVSDQVNLLMEDNTQMTKAVTPMYVIANPYLCIMVLDPSDDDAVRIEETGPYKVIADYAAGTAGAAKPPMDAEYELGSIGRNGTTVRFPYLTTREGYVQRIRIVNRGGEAKYTLDYATNAEAVEGEEKGVLESGERKVLMVRDVVEITDGSTTTAGTLIVEAQPNQIDVATTVNTADGGIDTFVYPGD